MNCILLYSQGDCYEEVSVSASAACSSTLNSCVVTSSANKVLGKCGDKKAEYFQIKYFCVPSLLI